MQRRITPVARTGLAACTALALAAGVTAALTPAAAAAAGPGAITIGGKCLDDADFDTNNGAVVQLYSCNGSAAQSWTWQDDGRVTITVNAQTKCLDVTGGSNATGALVQLYDCSSSDRQRFRYLPDGTIYSAKSGKCLAVQGGVVNNARVGLASCDPVQTAQKWQASTAPQPKYLLSAGADVPFHNGSDTPRSVYIDANGKFYSQDALALYESNAPRRWDFYSGTDFDTVTKDPISTAVNPADPADRNDDTTKRCDNSPTGLKSTYVSGSHYTQRNYCDLLGVWVDPDTGWWYGLVHNEFTPQPFGDGLHYDSIDYTVSKDKGKTWNIAGEAITSPFSTKRGDTAAFPHDTYYYGDGDPRLFVDHPSGYFYVFYASRALNKTGKAIWLQHVARAPISQKMAPSSWRKWYDGAWSTPGTGGAESNIIPSEGIGSGYTAPAEDYSPMTKGTVQTQVANGTMPDHSQLAVMNITWNAYLGKYIGTPQNNIAQATGTRTPLKFYATDDLATQKWTDIGWVPEVPNAAWYRWMLDPVSKTSTTIVGKTFRSYCLIDCPSTGAEITITPRSSADLPTPPVTASRTYRIGAANGRHLAQNGSALGTSPSGTAPAQQWRFKPTGDGFYSITNASSGQALGVGGGDAGRAWGAGVILGTLGAAPAVGQQWAIQEITQAPATSGPSVATGSFRLVNRYSGLALSLTDQGTQSVLTSPQRGWDNGGTAGDTRPVAAQSLKLTPVDGGSVGTVTVTNPGDRTGAAGSAIAPIQVQAASSSGAALTYAASGLPAGVSVNATTGQISGTPVSVGSRSVTLTVTDTTGASGFATFQWTVTGTDLARGRPTTASSTEAAGLGAERATDGSASTRWASTYSDPQWIRVDLGSKRSFKQVKLAWEAAYGKAYQIQTSDDGTTWTTVHATTAGVGGTEDLINLNGSGRYLRVYGTERGSAFGYSLWSIEVYDF
ncbi:ricin-type beta-trefoil lectin domain protein [Streptomyces sp. NPDC058486]|uniref:ricin-type beta-trefoil lectin domain protein n=1 Tax=unclassified Streptomyces TaxID=2593676 RepID=UPI00365BFE15